MKPEDVCGHLPSKSVVLKDLGGKFYSLGEKILKSKTFKTTHRKK